MDSDSSYPDMVHSLNGDEADSNLNHYRVPELMNFVLHGTNQSPVVQGPNEQIKFNREGSIMSLTELATQKVACHLPFGLVEHYDPPVPEIMQCRIAFWSFPQDEEAVKLYTCLANGNAEVFNKAEELISLNYVCDMLQVGFHLSANVKDVLEKTSIICFYRVAITFDRRRITSCSCSCSSSTFWCRHAVAVCLQRIRRPHDVTLRAPVSESLQRLGKNQLQKFAQYLINELPQQILPAAQKLLDELLSGEEAVINQNPGAPDPTAGATVNERTRWCLDDTGLSMNIRGLLQKQCTAQPVICSDVQSLHLIAPPSATEYSQLLRAIKGREPEGLWNLLAIVGEMMKRQDSNFFLLLDMITAEVLSCEKIVTWWFETKVSLHFGSAVSLTTKNGSQSTSQFSCSNFCDEIVNLWRLAAMNPNASQVERDRLYGKFYNWHLEILRLHDALDGTAFVGNLAKHSKRNILDLFPGFKPSMEGCLIDWSDWDKKKEDFFRRETELVDKKPKLSKARRKKRKYKVQRQENLDLQRTAGTVKPNGKQTCKNSSSNPSDTQDPSDTSDYKADIKNQETQDEASKGNLNSQDGFSNQESNSVDEARLIENNDEEFHQDEAENQEPEAAAEQDLERDLQVYFMNKSAEADSSDARKPSTLEELIKINVNKLRDPLETLYSKTESLYAHGYIGLARELALSVAKQILSSTKFPDVQQMCILPRRRKKRGGTDNRLSIVTSEALTRIIFLCHVLIDKKENRHLIFRLALFGIEMKRTPAATKQLEVKLINQKHDLITILKSMTLYEEELTILRVKAQKFTEDEYIAESDTQTALILGNFIFEALVLSKTPETLQFQSGTNNHDSSNESSFAGANQYHADEHFLQANHINHIAQGHHRGDQYHRSSTMIVHGKLAVDASLGFHAALKANGAKVNVAEADHPLLCEGTRRQRGRLVLSLLLHYKEDDEKLDLILESFLNDSVILSSHTLSELSSIQLESTKSSIKKSHPATDSIKASAHYIYEFAKNVYDNAGGNSSTAHLYLPQLMAQNENRTIHRGLHMCSLRIALYSLGLNNKISASWIQRTYSTQASFIHEQALDIGLTAIKYLREHWEHHLTPVEAASIADKAACCSDPELKAEAVKMAKSCLKYAHLMCSNLVRRILAQCKEQNLDMVKEACIEIEQVGQSGKFCPNVLFDTAKTWNSLCTNDDKKDRNKFNDGRPLLPDQNNPIANWQDSTNPTQELGTTTDSNEIISMERLEYVKTAHRVGLKAMDALKSNVNTKDDDILWLLTRSKLLGPDYLQGFCTSVMKNVKNPHLINIIAADLAKFLPLNDPNRPRMLAPLIEYCLEKFIERIGNLMKQHTVNDQKGYIESIIDCAQGLTCHANTITALDLFSKLVEAIGSRRKPPVIDVETYRSFIARTWNEINGLSYDRRPPLGCNQNRNRPPRQSDSTGSQQVNYGATILPHSRHIYNKRLVPITQRSSLKSETTTRDLNTPRPRVPLDLQYPRFL